MRIIYEDSRQQAGKHEHVNRWLKEHGIEIRRTKLFAGDYTLPIDQSVCVDTKYGLQEVYGNVICDHARFIREAVAAKEVGIRLIVLVEESGIETLDDVSWWVNPRLLRWQRLPAYRRKGKPPVSSDSLAKAMRTISERYGVEWQFCAKDKTAERLCEILGIEIEKPLTSDTGLV